MKLKKPNGLEALIVIYLFLALCEFLYTRNTGQWTKVVLAGFFAVGVYAFFMERQKLKRLNVIQLMVAFGVLLWSVNSQGIRYFLTLTTVVFWARHRFGALEKLIKIMAWLGIVLAFVQFAQGMTRVTGFYANSPTQMACTMYLFECYLLIRMMNTGVRPSTLLLCALCIIAIFLTETRSVLLAGAAVFAGYGIILFVDYSPIRSKKLLFVLAGLMLLLFLAVFAKPLISFVQSKFQRTNSSDSTNTRMFMYRTVLDIMRGDKAILLFGGKGGYTHELFKGVKGQYIPVHQDFLLFAVEYGLVGLVVILTAFLWGKRTALYFFMVYGVGAFHNVILNPVFVILLAVTMADMERRGDRMIRLKRLPAAGPLQADKRTEYQKGQL